MNLRSKDEVQLNDPMNIYVAYTNYYGIAFVCQCKTLLRLLKDVHIKQHIVLVC